MTFTPKNWSDSPSTSTPISAAALEDMETRLSDYTDQTAQPPTPASQAVAGFDTSRQNTSGKPLLVSAQAGVVSDPGENGHVLFQFAETNWSGTIYSHTYVACRNTTASSGQIGAGGNAWGIVPPNWYYRYTTETAAGYSTPQFLFNSGFEATYELG